jgi:nucleotide-binding universal stress UspA family protein
MIAMVETLLIAYDGSTHANEAVDDLASAGLGNHGRALVVSAVDAWLPDAASVSDASGRSDAGAPRTLQEGRERVLELIERQREVAGQGAARVRAILPGWVVATEVCAEAPAAAIIRRAEGGFGGIDGTGRRADLTVVGSRGLGALRRLLLGSVTQKLLHGLRASLRIGRGREAERAAGPLRIIVGVDGSADSDATVAAFAARRWPAGTEALVACYAQGIAGLEHSQATTIRAHSHDRSAMDAADSWASRTARRAADAIRAACPALDVSTIVRVADPRLALVAEASADGPAGRAADCVFVGARGVRGIERFLLGSVSSSVAMDAHCSVEIVQAGSAFGS